ncbi:MAG: hypothetical protein OXG72_02960, partial [Acidobacteria bacterium]|nr:hypothetical protein [Acidobacteriota bacterium]
MASRLYHAPRGWLLPRHALPPGRLATLRAARGIGMDRWRDRGESGRSIMKGMGSRGLAGRTLPVTLLALLIVAAPGRAFADLTVFAGRATTISRTSGGAALGLSLEPLSLEFEFAIAPARRSVGKPALRTGLFNLMVGTPSRTGRRIDIYGLVGGGMYRERFEEYAVTGFAVNGGGG